MSYVLNTYLLTHICSSAPESIAYFVNVQKVGMLSIYCV